jgi:REP-associated tyrosine transposase
MPFDPERHHRRSTRLQGLDDAAPGWYFVTICALSRYCLFGEVIDNGIDLSAFSHLAEVSWQAIPEHFPTIELDDFVVMPNHVHGIIVIAA